MSQTLSPHPHYHYIQEAKESLHSQSSLLRSGFQPEVGLILGSGLGSIANQITDSSIIDYQNIPHFFKTAVASHAGKVILGKLNGVSVVCLQGRLHVYEGYSMQDAVLPTRTLCALGIHTLILTNAAGGIHPQFRPTDLMLIEDHLNLMGDNPLKGPNLSELGPRFPDLSAAYHPECLKIMRATALELNISIHQGVYAGLLGPNYETPAEIRMLRTLGADAVGMSTVPETIVANHMGVRVAGLSCITNLAAGISSYHLTHQEVIESSQAGAEKITRLITAAMPHFSRL